MNQKQIFAALGALTLALAGCGGSQIEDTGDSTPGGAGSYGGAGNPGAGATSVTPGGGSTSVTPGGGATSTAGTGNPGGGGPGSGGGTSTPSTCVPGIPVTSQIPRMLNRQYDAVVRDLLGVTTVGTDNKAPSQMLFGDFDGNMTPDAWRLYQDTANQIAHDVMNGPNKTKFINCDPAMAGCLEQTIRDFGRKAFRHKLNDAEVARFVKLGQTTPKGTPAEVAETTLAAFLQSPSFLLIPELNTTKDATSGAIALSSQEVATRLSFLVWGSVPDDTLNTAADANMLTTKEQILAQAQRMIMVREKTAPLVTAFHRDWAQMNNANQHWWKIGHPQSNDYNATTAKASFSAEMDKFFEEVAYGGGSFTDLFTSPVAFVNQDNAGIYGLDKTKYTTELQKAMLDPTQRPGFLTRAGFLSSYSHSDGSTSPILRGAFIEIYMLGIDPGPPVDGATSMTVAGDFKTNRQYTEKLVENEPCKTCHSTIINPAGFALENFDSIGKWTTVDSPRGGPIDSTATVKFSATDSRQVTTPLELMQGITAQLKSKQIYASHWVSYAYGRAANSNDQCIVDQLGTKLSTAGYTVLNLMADLTQADSFRLRVRATP